MPVTSNSDRVDDVLVSAPSAPIASSITGRVYMFSGATGAVLWEPRRHRLRSPMATRRGFGTAIARLGDIGRCQFGGSSCTVNPQLDGAAEVLVSAPGTDIDSGAGTDEGVVYVLDGATGRTLKEIRLSAAERPLSGERRIRKGGDGACGAAAVCRIRGHRSLPRAVGVSCGNR